MFSDLWASLVSLLVRVSVNIDNNLIGRLREQIFYTGLVAALISGAICLLILIHYCRTYRREVPHGSDALSLLFHAWASAELFHSLMNMCITDHADEAGHLPRGPETIRHPRSHVLHRHTDEVRSMLSLSLYLASDSRTLCVAFQPHGGRIPCHLCPVVARSLPLRQRRV
jgi:hypothetical protein